MKLNSIAVLICGVLSALSISCNLPDEPDKPVIDEDVLVIDKEALVGTWFQEKNSVYGNENYISFDSKGYGKMVNAADWFFNPEAKPLNQDAAFVLLPFAYTVDDNQIKIYPTKWVEPFNITVRSQSRKAINFQFPSKFNMGSHDFELINTDPEWFMNEGPGSEDLTVGLTGVYTADRDQLRKFTVTKVNNYTLTISDRFGDVTTGHLYWSDLHNPQMKGIRSLNSIDNPSTGLPPYYEFHSDGKLYVCGIYIDYSATKESE